MKLVPTLSAVPSLLLIFLSSSLATALPSPEPLPDISLRDTTNTTNNNPTCTPTTWFVANFHTYQPNSTPVIPYLAFYFTMYDSTGSLARASCSRIGTAGQSVDDLLYRWDPKVWYKCHAYHKAKSIFESGGRGDYEFQWNHSESTLYVRGNGKCGQTETRVRKLEPLRPNVPWTFSTMNTGDVGDEKVNPYGFYSIYGQGGEFKLETNV